MDYQVLNLLYKCSSAYSHKRIRGHFLSDTEYMICTFAYAHPNASQEEISTALRMDKSTVGKAIASLERKQYILRTLETLDKRKKRVSLTELGSGRIEKILNLHNVWLECVLSVLSEPEQAQFEEYCKRLLSAAEQLVEKHEGGGVRHGTRKEIIGN